MMESGLFKPRPGIEPGTCALRVSSRMVSLHVYGSQDKELVPHCLVY